MYYELFRLGQADPKSFARQTEAEASWTGRGSGLIGSMFWFLLLGTWEVWYPRLVLPLGPLVFYIVVFESFNVCCFGALWHERKRWKRCDGPNSTLTTPCCLWEMLADMADRNRPEMYRSRFAWNGLYTWYLSTIAFAQRESSRFTI